MSGSRSSTCLAGLARGGRHTGTPRPALSSGLRAFSTSFGFAADSRSDSRSARSANAAKEVSSFRITRTPVNNPLSQQPSKGVDARGLAASPSQGSFVIRRVDAPIPRQPGHLGRGRASPSASGRGGFGRSPRGRDGSSTYAGTRREGGAPGGGRFPGTASTRGRFNRRAPRRSKNQPETEDEASIADRPLSGADWKSLDEKYMGQYTAVVPPKEQYMSLDSHGVNVATISAPEGLKESVLEHMRIATRGTGDQSLVHPTIHFRRLKKGRMTVLESREQQQVVETVWTQTQLKAIGKNYDVRPAELPPLPTISGKAKDAVASELVAGRYTGPGWADVTAEGTGNALQMVKSIIGRNGSYHTSDQRKLEKRLLRLLPDPKAKQIAL